MNVVDDIHTAPKATSDASQNPDFASRPTNQKLKTRIVKNETSHLGSQRLLVDSFKEEERDVPPSPLRRGDKKPYYDDDDVNADRQYSQQQNFHGQNKTKTISKNYIDASKSLSSTPSIQQQQSSYSSLPETFPSRRRRYHDEDKEMIPTSRSSGKLISKNDVKRIRMQMMNGNSNSIVKSINNAGKVVHRRQKHGPYKSSGITRKGRSDNSTRMEPPTSPTSSAQNLNRTSTQVNKIGYIPDDEFIAVGKRYKSKRYKTNFDQATSSQIQQQMDEFEGGDVTAIPASNPNKSFERTGSSSRSIGGQNKFQSLVSHHVQDYDKNVARFDDDDIDSENELDISDEKIKDLSNGVPIGPDVMNSNEEEKEEIMPDTNSWAVNQQRSSIGAAVSLETMDTSRTSQSKQDSVDDIEKLRQEMIRKKMSATVGSNEEENIEITGEDLKAVRRTSIDVPLSAATSTQDAKKSIGDSRKDLSVDMDMNDQKQTIDTSQLRKLPVARFKKQLSKADLKRRDEVSKKGSTNGIPLAFLASNAPTREQEEDQILGFEQVPVKIVRHETTTKTGVTEPKSSTTAASNTTEKWAMFRPRRPPTTSQSFVKDAIAEDGRSGELSLDVDEHFDTLCEIPFHAPLGYGSKKSRKRQDDEDEESSIGTPEILKHEQYSRRNRIICACICILVCAAIITAIALTIGKNDEDVLVHPCQRPIEEQSLVARCHCYNSTGNFYEAIDDQGKAEYQRQLNFLIKQDMIVDNVSVSETEQCSDVNVMLLTSVNLTLHSDEGVDFFSQFSDGFHLNVLSLIYTYVTMEGLFWKHTEGWLTDSICGWFGLKCSRFNEIIEFNVAGNGLKKTIPTYIGYLTSLQSLNLSNNTISGTLPTEIGALKFLHTLNMSGNGLSGVPTEIKSLRKLDNLDLSFNQLSGSFPFKLFSMIDLQFLNLRFLNIGNNNFGSKLPTELGLFTNLVELSLDGNQFSGSVPTEIGKMENLESLKLNNNNFQGTIPNFLGSMTRLRHLELYNSGLTGGIPESFCNELHPVDRTVVIDCISTVQFDDCSCCSRKNPRARVQLQCIEDLLRLEKGEN